MKNTLRLTQKEFLSQYGVQRSSLTYHNFGSQISEYLEIDMPYMLLYEYINLEEDRASFIEFTNSDHNYIYNTVSALGELGARPLHKHDFYELTFVLSGEVTLCIENETVTYKAGECCLCNRNIRHRELFNSDFEIVLLLFQEEYILQLLKDNITYSKNGHSIVFHSSIQKLIEQNRTVPFYAVKEYIDFTITDPQKFEAEQYIGLLNNILNELYEKNSGSSYIIQGYLCRFLSLLENPLQYRVETHRTAGSKEEDLFIRISLCLEEHSGRITRTDLEEQLCYNGDYMNRVVKKYSGMTLQEYSQFFTLQKAAALLKHTEMRIGEICHKLGYSNRSYFNCIFTKKYGVSPSEYRKRN